MTPAWEIDLTESDCGFLLAWLHHTSSGTIRFALTKSIPSSDDAHRYAQALQDVLSAPGADPGDRDTVVAALKAAI